MNWLLVLVPISLVLAYGLHAPPMWVFFAAVLAIVPLADRVRQGTEQIAQRAGSAIGGLLNVSFGNAPELILALFVLMRGEVGVVKAQITGSIIGNSLLGTGLAILVGCWGREKLTFNRERAGMLSSMLILAMIALLIPALFEYSERGQLTQSHLWTLDERLSLCVSVVLILVYIANLIYTLVTHRDIFRFGDAEDAVRTVDSEEMREAEERAGGHGGAAPWPMWKALAVLVVATCFTALEAELVSGALEATAGELGLSKFFLGVIVLAVVGNAAEYVAAVYFARQGRMDLSISITVGSTIQVALLAAPILVIASYFLHHPMNLVFSNPLELVAVAGTAFAINAIAQDGETTWFEGVLLVAVYVLLGLAFFFHSP